MRIKNHLGFLLFACVFGLFWYAPQTAWATTFTVNSTDDTNDGTCTNPYVNAANDCTMREGINAANASAGADTIKISIHSSFTGTSDGHGQQTTTVATAYNALTGQVTIDATGMWDTDENRPGFRMYSTSTTLAGFSFSTGSSNSKLKGIEIEGYNAAINVASAASNVIIGTDCDGTNDSIERNVFHKASDHEIRFQGSGSVLAGNYLGVNDDGITVDGSTLEDVWISGASADSNFVGFREGLSCTAAQQRNIIGGTSSLTGGGIKIEGAGTTNQSGDSTLAPNGNSIAGNYIGIGSDGTTKIANVGPGIYILSNATLNFIGTDGDGVSDSSEGNVISGNGTGVYVLQTGTNRISGNRVGVNAAGTAAVANGDHGMNIRGTANVIGWCDSTVNSSLCSNSGVLADERNTVSGNTADGIRLGFQALSNIVYGNYIGTAIDGTATIANAVNGIFIHRTNTGNIIGGSSDNQANLIQGNAYGVRMDGNFIGTPGVLSSQVAVSGNTIQNNTITQNGVGIYNYWTENFSTAGPIDNTITGNSITANTSYGIDVYGSSPAITSNTISNNGSYGIYLHPAYVTYDDTGEATTTSGANPANATDNLISRPTITGNTLSGNTSGGIYQFDTRANNYTTLETDNTIGDNNSLFDIQQDWLGTVEVLDAAGVPIPATDLAGTEISLTPQTGSSTSYATSATTTLSDVTQNIYGSSGLSYTDVTTWPTITEYTINSAGSQTNYGPYTITTSGTYESSVGYSYSFDGTDNDTTYLATLPNGITTDDQYRYQIAKVLASTVPTTPTNAVPEDAATLQSLTLTVSASAFADVTDTNTQVSATWRIYSSSASCSAGSTGDVLNTTSTSSLTSFPVPADTLTEETTYYWRVAYTNSFGNRSSFSACTSFTTIQTTPSFAGTISSQSWNEDATNSSAFDLDSYFSDQESEALTFSVLTSDTPEQITVNIDVNGVVSFVPAADYYGSDSVTFKACDPDSQCATSNSVTLNVLAVNDAPLAPSTGFSPSDSNTTTDLTPEISWTAATDVDNSASELSYELRLGTDSTPSTTFTVDETTATGIADVSLSDDLTDETTYYYVVRTTDAEGAVSDWSAVQQFYVNQAIEPSVSLSKQASVGGTSWLFQIYHWVNSMSAFLPFIFPVSASDQVITAAQTGNTSAQQYFRSGNTVVSQITPLGALAVVIETAIGMFLLAFAVSFVVLLRQSHTPKHFFGLLFGNPASTFFDLFMGDNVTIEAISYAHFKAKLQLLRVLLAATIIGVAVLAVAHAGLAPASPIAAKFASQASSGNVEPNDTVTITLTYSNAGDGDATDAQITDTLPNNTTFVSGSAVVDGVNIADNDFISGTTIFVQLGTITDRNSSGHSGTVTYQLKVDNPYLDSRLLIAAASLNANELSSAITSDSLSFDVTRAVISGQVLDSITGNGLSGVHLTLSQEGTTIETALTNSEGTYSVSGLGDGDYRLDVEIVDGYDEADGRRMTLEAGDSLSIDFSLSPTVTTIPTDSNGNTNSDTNSNTNSDVNTNSNSNDNANVNGDSNANTNTDTNQNTNTNENTNTTINLNTNENLNTNSEINTNVDINTNANSNTNSNSNTNANKNTNSNSNTNTGGNTNSHVNQNTNTNTGTNDEPTIPQDVQEDLPILPSLTPEQQQLQNDLTSSLSLDTIDDTQAGNGVLGFLGANSVAGLPPEYAQNIDKILLPDDSDEFDLKGHALPDSKVTITICSAAYVQVTQTDSNGSWNMIVPRNLFDEGEHVAVATANKDGVDSEQLEIARFVTLDQLAVTSRPALVIGLNVLLLALFTNIVLWGAKRGRSKQTDPLLPETTPSPLEQKQNRRRLLWSFTLYALAIAAFVAVFFIPHPRLFSFKATLPADAEKIVLSSINQQKVTAGTTSSFNFASILHLEGLAPKDTLIAITLCPGVTFRSTASGPNGEWAMDIPLIVLPKGQFSLEGQFDVNGTLGIPHTIAEFKVQNIQILPRDYFLYFISLLSVLLGTAALWRRVKVVDTETASMEPSDLSPID